MRQKVVMVWSGGKDSSMALQRLLADDNIQVCHLLTSLNSATQRVSMHGVRKELLVEQSKSIGIPITFVEYQEASYSAYEEAMEKQIREFQNEGIHHFAFGDIFLEDLKIYREQQLAKVYAEALFPLWKEDTKELIKKFVEAGFKSITCCIDAQKLSSEFLGKTIDKKWLRKLPLEIDPCGENGEYHSFCYDGPIFKLPLKVKLGERVKKEYQHDQYVSAFQFVEIYSG